VFPVTDKNAYSRACRGIGAGRPTTGGMAFGMPETELSRQGKGGKC